MSSEGWKKVQLGDILTLHYGKALVSRDRNPGFIPVYSSSGITGWHDKPLVNDKGIIIGRKGNVGSIYYSDTPFYCIDTAYYVTPDDTDVDFMFLYYLLQTLGLNGLNEDSAVPGLNRETALAQWVSIPVEKQLQTLIANQIAAFDEKIKLNRQTNATLEAIAQAIFKEWFVDFNYPGATGELVESELGPIPKGWRVGRLGEICKVTMGQSPPGESYNEDGIGTPFFQGRADFDFRFPRKRVFTTNPSRFANKFDTLVSVRAPVGDMNIATENCCIGRGLAAVIERNGNYSFTYYFLKELTEQFKGFEDSGTVFGSINKNDFENLTCIIPTIEIITSYEEKCRVIDDEIFNCEQESRTLTIIRDAILPKLMSREIEL